MTTMVSFRGLHKTGTTCNGPTAAKVKVGILMDFFASKLGSLASKSLHWIPLWASLSPAAPSSSSLSLALFID